MSHKQLAANRRNALQSTGPTTSEGVELTKMNAVRHGLRALQTVVPGENLDDWEAHWEAIEADLNPQGAVEAALAEQVAVKLWRLARVVRHEADLITNARDKDELLRAHEKCHHRVNTFGGPDRTDIPTRKDVTDARRAMDKQAEIQAVRVQALRDLKALATMTDEDTFLDWTLYESLRDDFQIGDPALEQSFAGEPDDTSFNGRIARKMIAYVVSKEVDAEDLLGALADAWSKKLDQTKQEADSLKAKYRRLARRYKAALERRRRLHGLPGSKDLDRIQRYEAHLERGLHKALDRIRDLQEARGAVPPRAPSLAVAVLQTGPETPPENQMGSFGSFALEAANGVQEVTEGDDHDCQFS